MNQIYQYGQQWSITFNATKTIQQTFSLKKDSQPPALTFGGTLIPCHNNHKHLGLTFSKDLRFHEHINDICHKVNKTLSPLYPLARHLPRFILDQLYKTYIRPHFDYCDTIYDGYITIKDATRLETLQNRAARLSTGALFRTSTDRLRADLGWDKLTIRRRIHRLLLYHKLNDPRLSTHDYITATLPVTRAHATGRALRNASSHSHATVHTSLHQNSFFNATIRNWNELPITIRTLDHKDFKKEIARDLSLHNPPKFYTVGTKKYNTLHARLRMEMSQLNAHLFQIQKADSPACPCGHSVENTRHFILFCPEFTHHRTALFSKVSHILGKPLIQMHPLTQLSLLLQGTDLRDSDGRAIALCFQEFLKNSNRFPSLDV